MPHDLRRKESVLNNLHHGKDDERHQEDKPEVLSRIGSLDNGQNNGGDKAYQLEVRYHVEQSDEQAQADGHWEVDNQETDAEQYAYTQGHQCLTAEILVHTFLNVSHQPLGKRTIATGQQ